MKAATKNKIGQLIRTVSLGFLVLLPPALLLLLSFSDTWSMPSFFPERNTFRHWQQQFESNLAFSLGLSLLLGFFVATLSTVGGFFVSKMIAQQTKQTFWRAINLLPYVLSPIIYAAALQFFFVKFNLSGTFLGVALAQLLIAFPYGSIVWSSFWQEKTFDMEALVYTLGGTKRQALVRVLFPMAKGLFGICFFQTFLISWFDYAMASLIGLGKAPTLTIRVFQLINEANIHAAAVASLCLVLPPMLFLLMMRIMGKNKSLIFNDFQ